MDNRHFGGPRPLPGCRPSFGDLEFSAAEINELLKSLVKMQDVEGLVSGVNIVNIENHELLQPGNLTLEDLGAARLENMNDVFVPWQGSAYDTRNYLPALLRRKGISISYVTDKGIAVKERAVSDVGIDNANWGLDSNWMRVDELSLNGELYVSPNGTWVINGVDSGIQALGPKGDNGLTPRLKTIDNKLHYSYDGKTWVDSEGEYISVWFRWSGNKIQISRDNKTWADFSGEFADNLFIKGYVATFDKLPANAVQGDIWGVGPRYAAEDTENTNPIYRYWVRNAGGWVDNGEFTSIKAGIVQETGDGEGVVMSQKAVSEKLTELESEKVSAPNFSVTENNVLYQRIKELYLFNIDSSKYYYIYNCIFNQQYETYQFYVCRSNNKEEADVSPLEIVALYDNRIKPDGIVPLTMNDEIVGYALLDIKEEDGMDMGRKELVTLDVVSNLDYNPAIKQYLSTFEIEKKLTKFAVNAQYSVSSNNIANSRFKEIYLKGIKDNTIYYLFNGGYSLSSDTYQIYICKADSEENIGVDVVKNIVGAYDRKEKPVGIVPLTTNGLESGEIVGYFVAEINQEDETSDVRYALLNNTIVSNLDYNPAIKEYITIETINNELKKKVSVPRFSITENNELNQKIKELYLNDVDTSKYYYIYNFVYNPTYNTYQFYICRSNSKEDAAVSPLDIVALYDDKVKPKGIIPLTLDGKVVGYALFDMNESDHMYQIGRKESVNLAVVSNLDYNPAIKEHLSTVDINNRISELESEIRESYADSISINETTPINVKTSEYPTMNIVLSDKMLYIRTSYDENRDIMLSYSLENANNVFAATQVWIGDKNLSDSQLRSNANLFHDAFDSNPPLPTINFGYLGGNHGLYTLKVHATGKTKDDIGSIYAASAYGDFELVDIDSANGIMWLAPVILQDDTRPYPYRKWWVNNPVGNTFTYKSGGVTTNNIVATSVEYGNSAQYAGTAKKARIVFELDGKVIAPGNHAGKHLVVYEEYNIIDAANIYQYHDMIAESLAKYRLTYEFCGASCIIHTDLEAVKDVYLNYYAPIQPVGIQDRNENTAYFMMPKTSYETLTDVDNVASRLYYRNDSDLIDVNRLPERAMWAYKDASGKLISAYAAGSSLLHGDGMNEIRTKNVLLGDAIHSLAKPAGWCKWYPRQNNNGRIKAGNHVNWTAYITYFAPADDVITWSNYEADVKVTYIHCLKDVNMTFDMKDRSQIQILELSGVDYILEDKMLTIMGNSGDYIVISSVT